MEDSPAIAEREYWTWVVTRLEEELEAVDDPGERTRIRHALFRVLFDHLKDTREAFRHIDIAKESFEPPRGVLWDAWRASAKRESVTQSGDLQRLIPLLQDPEDRAEAYLDMAAAEELRGGEAERVSQLEGLASQAKEDSKGVLWTRLKASLVREDYQGAADILDSLARSTSDPLWRSALLTEKLVLKRDGASREEIREIVQEILGNERAGWMAVNEVRRSTYDMELWALHVEALERLARAALSPETGGTLGADEGSRFDGFLKGEEVAAGYYWLGAHVLENRLGDRRSAIELLEKALAVRPESVFVAKEMSRLKAASGSPYEGLLALPDGVSPVWKAELALLAKRSEIARGFIEEAAGSVSSPYLEALRSAASGSGTDPEQEPKVSSDWLTENPLHSSAADVAQRLLEGGEDSLLVRLICEESQDTGGTWPKASSDQEGSWDAACAAVASGRMAGSSELARWAKKVTSPELRAAIEKIAALAMEREGQDEGALELAVGLRDEVPRRDLLDEQISRLLRKMDRRVDLAEHLKDVAETTLDQSAGSEALCERALLSEYGVGDLSSALEDFEELQTRVPGEPLWVWSAFRIAARTRDWSEAVGHLEKLRDLCSEERPRLELLAADLNLFALGNTAEAARLYSNAIDGLEDEGEKESARAGASLCASFGDRVFPDPGRQVQGDFACHERLAMELWGDSEPDFGATGAETEGAATALRPLWDVMNPSRGESRANDYRRLGALFEGRAAEACLAASVLWQDDLQQEVNSSETCPVVVRLAQQRGAVLKDPMADLDAELTDEEVDSILDKVDLLAREGKLEDARGIISAVLPRAPDHPGVLEAYARLASMCEHTADLVDAHGRLAGFYSGKGEKAANLARAASLMLEELNDVKGAERIAREALKREPNHEEAHRVLTAVLTERGDEGALVKQIEDRIDAEKDKDSLVELYEEQVDRLFAVDDTTGALEAVDKILDLKPDYLPAYRTRIDLLATREEFEEAVAAIMEFTFLCEDPAEKRSVIWRAAQIAAEDMGDRHRGLQILEDLLQEGDSHPQTERLIAQMAGFVGEWEKVFDALGRLAGLVSDPLKKASVLQEQARVALEHLFEPDRAQELLDGALDLDPGSVESVKLSVQFREEEASQRILRAAGENLQERCFQSPLDETLVLALKEICAMAGRDRMEGLCDESIDVLRAAPPSADEPSADGPGQVLEPDSFFASLIHPQEADCAAAEVALLAAPVTSEAFKDRYDGPRTGKGTLVSRKAGDPVFEWLKPYAAMMGLEKFELHRSGREPRGARPALCPVPGVVLDDGLVGMPTAVQRFFVARALWRSRTGLGAFEEGDTSTPVRWISALTAATLGADAKLPIPTDRELVDLAVSALPRRVRKRLVEPCQRILEMDPQVIRGWAAATSFSADRFGLLAAGTLKQVVMPVVEETAGPVGLRRYAENPKDALSKVPRCLELLRFVLSSRFAKLEDSLGISRTGGK